jgi:class 3 adenylate cyclase
MMPTKEDLAAEVKEVMIKSWSVGEARVVPSPDSLKLSNDARHFERATILYADLSGSTELVNNFPWEFAGEVYKSFLIVSAKVIRLHGGQITSYDGDRIMAVFIGEMQTTTAAKCGLQINWAVRNIVNPALQEPIPS